MAESDMFWPAFMLGVESGLLLAMAAMGLTQLLIRFRSRVGTSHE